MAVGETVRGSTPDPTRPGAGTKKQAPAQFRHDLKRLSAAILIAGAVAALLYAVQFDLSPAFAVLGSAASVACAAAAIGSLLGFLFGIPKTLQSDRVGDEDETRYLANTNLEQISDWLTKILVGIGLVQIARTPDALASLARSLRPLFGDTKSSAAFGLSFALYFAVSGFLVAYLWTRALLRGVLEAADRDIGARIEAELSKREDANAEALALAARQLAGQALPDDELERAIAAASPDYLVQIYGRAEEQRQRNWQLDKDTMVRTIPVFKALADADREHRYFRHFASLGFALKDQPQPDFAGAEKALTTAIAVRGKSKTLLIYEWNRALCRIHLDPAFSNEQPSADQQRAGIEADLRTTARQFAERYFMPHPDDPDTTTIGRWLELNGLSYADLKREQRSASS